MVLTVPPAAFAVAADRDFVLRWTAAAAVDGAPHAALFREMVGYRKARGVGKASVTAEQWPRALRA